MSHPNCNHPPSKRAQGRFWLSVFLTLALLLPSFHFPAVPTAAAADNGAKLTMTGQEPITSGAILKKYVWTTKRKDKPVSVNVNVIEVNLHNPLVRLDTMAGTNDKYTKRQTIRGMATEKGAVAAVNGDFYNMQAEGVPIGPQIMEGRLLATPPYLPGFYSFALTKDNKPVIDLFTFEGSIIAKDGASYPLGGINKTYYWFEPSGQHSMIDGLYMYTSTWDYEIRSNDGVTVPTEVLVEDGIIKDIKSPGVFDMKPPENGYILRASGKATDFVNAHLKIGDPITADYAIKAQDPTRQYDTANFKMMIGGHTILVNDGKPAEFSRKIGDIDGNYPRSRTGIGYSKDGKFVYLITVDKSETSGGATIPEFQQMMIQIGVWKGMNLDGGGSTQMVARPLGETQVKLVNQLEYGTERRVVNGIAVYSNAPAGKPKAIQIVGPKKVLAGEKAAYSIKGYDEYYNPLQSENVQVDWSASGASSQFAGNVFTAQKIGQAKITAAAGSATASMDVTVIGRNEIASMAIRPSTTVIRDGDEVQLSVHVKLKDGTERTVSGELFKWELKGFEGRVTGDKLHVDKISPETPSMLIARYDGFSTMVPLYTGMDRVWADFDQVSKDVQFASTEAVVGEVAVEAGLYGLAANNKAVRLRYDMTNGGSTRAAYIQFGADGTPVSGSPQSMSVNVYGDNGKNWLRAEIIDAKGETKRVDLAKSVDWSGWKTVTADLTAHQMVYPIKLRRIYLASVEQGRETRAASGEIAVDDIVFHYKHSLTVEPRNSISLTIDKPEITINGKTEPLEVAPYIDRGNTMVPIRFVTEALQGQVEWDETERKATVFRGYQMVDFWLDKLTFIANGKAVEAEVPPVLKGERTMVPLRILSEQLGWKVTWHPETRMVTLE